MNARVRAAFDSRTCGRATDLAGADSARLGRRSWSTFFVSFLILLASLPARGDAWARGRGSAYLFLGAARTSATTAFDPGGARIPFPGRGATLSRTNAYFESGLNDAVTLVANVPYQVLTSRGLFNDFRTAGLADLDLRIRLSRPTPAGVFAIEGGAFVPLGYRRVDFPQLGNGYVEPVVNLAYGTSLRQLPGGFLSLQGGYRARRGELSDELPYSVKVGAFPHPRIGTFVFARGWKSRGDFRNTDPTFALVSADSESLSAGGELYFRITPRIDINAAWSRVVRGRNTSIGDEIAIGFAVHTR